jgi:hypothetical protein
VASGQDKGGLFSNPLHSFFLDKGVNAEAEAAGAGSSAGGGVVERAQDAAVASLSLLRMDARRLLDAGAAASGPLREGGDLKTRGAELQAAAQGGVSKAQAHWNKLQVN